MCFVVNPIHLWRACHPFEAAVRLWAGIVETERQDGIGLVDKDVLRRDDQGDFFPIQRVADLRRLTEALLVEVLSGRQGVLQRME